MKFNKLISMLMSLALISAVNPVPVYAQPDSELFNLYSEYFEDKTVTEIISYDPGEFGVVYNIMEKPLDCICIAIPTNYDIKLDLEKLLGSFVDENYCILYNYFFSAYMHQYLTIESYSDNHDLNRKVFNEIYTVLKEKYKIFYAYIEIDSIPIQTKHQITWDTFNKMDEFGYEIPTDEYLSKKKINSIRNSIASDNFAVTIDDDGNIIFDKTASETEKFRFAIWFKKEYGFYVLNNLSYYYKKYNATEVIHSTEIPGDVNNDNYVDNYDAKVLQEYLLSGSTDVYVNIDEPYQYFNAQNADLTGDGVLDVFDLVLLRKQLIDSN